MKNYLHPLVTMILWPPFFPADAGGMERIATVTTTKAAMRVILVQDILENEQEEEEVEGKK